MLTRSPRVDFARRASSARSGASPCRTETPHTWLSPASSERYSSTVSLRHVRGSPALRLLRRLRPPIRDVAGLGSLPGFACPAPGWGSLVPGRNPWCGRWSASSPGSADRRRFGARQRRTHTGHIQPEILRGRTRTAFPAVRRDICSIQRVSTPTSPCRDDHPCVVHRGTCGSPPTRRVAGILVRSTIAGRPSNLGRRSRTPSPAGPTRPRMTYDSNYLSVIGLSLASRRTGSSQMDALSLISADG